MRTKRIVGIIAALLMTFGLAASSTGRDSPKRLYNRKRNDHGWYAVLGRHYQCVVKLRS